MNLTNSSRVINLDITLWQTAKCPLKPSTVITLESDSAVMMSQTRKVTDVIRFDINGVRVGRLSGIGLGTILFFHDN